MEKDVTYGYEEETLNSKPNLWCVIPYYIIENTKLTPQAKLLFGVISGLCRSKGFCWATNQYLASILDTDKRTVTRCMEKLIKERCITTEIKDNHNRKIYVIIHIVGGDGKNDMGDRHECHTMNSKYIKSYSDKLRLSSNSGVREENFDLNDNNTFAKRLVKALQSKRKIMCKVNLPIWSCQLREIKSEVGQKRFEPVFDWYLEHLSDKYTPKAYSALSFAKKFYAIEDAMNRQQPAVLLTPVTEQTKKIAKDVWDEWNWPATVKPQLKPVLQVCLDNITEYYKYQQKWLEVNKPKKAKEFTWDSFRRLYSFAEHINDYISIPTQFVQYWFKRIYELNGRKKYWDGDLTQYIFNTKHTIFIEWGRQRAAEWCEKPERWDDYIKLLYSDKPLKQPKLTGGV